MTRNNIRVEEIDQPKPGSGDALVRTHAVVLNGFAQMLLGQTTMLQNPLPMIPCTDAAGYEAVVDLSYIWSRELSLIDSDGWTKEDQAEIIENDGRRVATVLYSQSAPFP